MIFFCHSSPFSSSVARLRTPKRGSIDKKIFMPQFLFEFLNNFIDCELFGRCKNNKKGEADGRFTSFGGI